MSKPSAGRKYKMFKLNTDRQGYKIRPSHRTDGTDKGLNIVAANYWGDGSDGNLSTTGNVSLANTQDGDVVVKQYSSLTINSGHTFTTQYRCRGLVIYVDGDCVINGILSMNARGCKCNPADATTSSYTPVAPSDGSAVGANGIRFVRAKSGITETLSASEVNGCGNALKNIEANQNGINANGKIYAIPRVGASGGGSAASGSAGSSGQSGGGGGGSTGTYSVGGAGTAGTCFSGGTGGGGGTYSSSYAGYAGTPYGGAGGAGRSAGGYYGGGGAGNPGGGGSVAGGDGTGGLLVLFVKGNLTIGSSGAIQSKGLSGGAAASSGGGGSGGGIVLMLYAGSYSNSGTISVAGGASVTNSGAGGSGNAVIEKVDL